MATTARAAPHDPAELTFVDADERTNTVTYRAASASHPGEWNTVALEVLTMQASCDCRAARAGRPCWHTALVDLAWWDHPLARECRLMTAEQLARAGGKARRMCRVYRARTWNTLPHDRQMVVAARGEWRRRHPATVTATEEVA